MANNRQGTNKTKERAEIAGSTRRLKNKEQVLLELVVLKILFLEEGYYFGPRVRSYSQKLNKNVKKLARKSALSMKMKEKAISVVEDFDFDTPKTKSFTDVVNALGLSDKKALFVLGSVNKNIYLSSRNLKEVVLSLIQK